MMSRGLGGSWIGILIGGFLIGKAAAVVSLDVYHVNDDEHWRPSAMRKTYQGTLVSTKKWKLTKSHIFSPFSPFIFPFLFPG